MILNCCLIYRSCLNYWLKHPNSEEKNKTSNFKLHLGMINSKVSLNKTNISFDDIATIDLSKINKEIFEYSINFLNNSIDNYLINNPDKNLINIAKSKEFTDYLIEHLDNKLNSEN